MQVLLYLLTIYLCFLLSGCKTVETIYKPMPRDIKWQWYLEKDENNIINWSEPNFYFALEMWNKEIEKHLDGDWVIFVCHGIDAGFWTTTPNNYLINVPVKEVAKELVRKYPNHVIFIIVCNEGGYELDLEEGEVYYPKQKIWLVPDSFVTRNKTRLLMFKQKQDDNHVGGFLEFSKTD